MDSSTLNKEYILFHLREAKEELDRTILDLERDPEYDFGEFSVAIQHLYHHVNTAWNAREVSVAEAEECSEENFYRWRLFPQDVEMGN